MTRFPAFRLAAVQAAPVFLDPAASTEKACRLIREAAARGAALAAFGEAWLPGFPFFLGAPMDEAFWRASAEYIASAVEVPGPETDRLCRAACEAGIDVAIGVVERDPRTLGTVWCTALLIGGREGAIIGRHRKLKPTHRERTIWGDGPDGSGLRAHQRPYARVSALSCYEHMMLLPGYALVAQGTQVHVAGWPGWEPAEAPRGGYLWPRQTLLSRAFAAQGACYVLCVGGLRRREDVPERFRGLCGPDMTGDSLIIDPRGEVIAGPAEGETILVAGVSLEAVAAAKAVCDVAGHYARPDVFEVRVDGQPLAVASAVTTQGVHRPEGIRPNRDKLPEPI
ncbi:carbon-nitrogen hydrolase family protein [Belnapia sp. T18]|uniref:Carbon-nitrogen hydrolase family protein n=1 Tax=Belnapia arida TaxID=2804533 RepID=A0ABS1U9Y9_9PROT|nr:carbon-nitrogen hydrolase family protein [Belnapia arida]MBL6081498.1 carbon-nitrogen hydrolase family protein [Belnapia arida]